MLTTFMTNMTAVILGVFEGGFGSFYISPGFAVLLWWCQAQDAWWTNLWDSVLCLDRHWLCAITQLVWRTGLDMRSIPSVSWEAPQRTGSLHGLHPTTTSPTDHSIRYQRWIITGEEGVKVGSVCPTYWMLFGIFYCFIFPTSLVVFGSYRGLLILPVFSPPLSLLLPVSISPTCLHPSAHLPCYSASQDKRASPLWGGRQTEPQLACQQCFTG